MGTRDKGEKFPSDAPCVDLDTDLVYFPHQQPDGFYHWLIDTLPSFGILQESRVELDSDCQYYVHRLTTGFQRDHLRERGIALENVLSHNGLAGPSRSVQPVFVRARRLVVPQFRGVDGPWPNALSLRYLVRFYARPDVIHPVWQGGLGPRLLYVSRGDDARRGIRNESELLAALEATGFRCLSMEGRSLEDQALIFRDADFILASHGAGLANVVFNERAAPVFEFFGSYLSNHFRMLSALLGHEYHVIAAGIDDTGHPLPINTADRNAGYAVDVDKIVRTVDSLLTADSPKRP